MFHLIENGCRKLKKTITNLMNPVIIQISLFVIVGLLGDYISEVLLIVSCCFLQYF
jgi:hypothetical protein